MRLTNNPLVSVIIPTYKRPLMLSRAIDSVLNQTYKNIEIIVVDDNNPNTEYRTETEKVMINYINNKRIKYIKHKKNMNGAAARNTGLMNSSGEIVCFLDDDDWYLKEKIQKQVQYLLNNPEYDAVYCGYIRYGKLFLPKKEGNLTFEVLSGTSQIITNTIMIKKEAALNSGGWDERFSRNQEAAFLIRFFNKGYKIGVVDEVLVMFDTSDRSNNPNPRKYEKNIDFFLSVHKKQINECDEKIPSAKKIIFSSRYRAVLLNYLKNKDILGALKLYIKLLKLFPIRFNIDLLNYIFSKLKSRVSILIGEVKNENIEQKY